MAGQRAGRALGGDRHAAPGRAAARPASAALAGRGRRPRPRRVVVLFDAAARFVDRLPGARTEVFLDHVLGQELPADTIAPSADRGEAVRLLTAHAAKGLEWDVVVVAGVQEGIWPDLRLRGSLLGSERLVDVVAGRAGAGRGGAAGRRRPPRCSTRSAGCSTWRSPGPGGGCWSPRSTRARSAARTARSSRAASWPSWRARRPAVTTRTRRTSRRWPGCPGRSPCPALVAELRAAVTGPAIRPAAPRRPRPSWPGWPPPGVPGAHPDEWWGLRRAVRRPAAGRRRASRSGSPRPRWRARCGAACAGCWSGTAARAPASAAQGVGNLVHAAAMLAEDASADRQALVEYVAGRFDAIELAARWLAGREQDRAEAMVDKLLRWLAANPRRLLAIEREFAVRLDDPSAADRADRPGRPAGGRRRRAGSSSST